MGYYGHTIDELARKAGVEDVRQWSLVGNDRDNPLDLNSWGINTVTVEQAQARSWNTVNNALSKLFSSLLPFTSVTLPPVLVPILIAFTIHDLATGQGNEAEEEHSKNFTLAREALARIATGEDPLMTPQYVNLTEDALDQEQDRDTRRHTAAGPTATPYWTRESLADYAENVDV